MTLNMFFLFICFITYVLCMQTMDSDIYYNLKPYLPCNSLIQIIGGITLRIMFCSSLRFPGAVTPINLFSCLMNTVLPYKLILLVSATPFYYLAFLTLSHLVCEFCRSQWQYCETHRMVLLLQKREKIQEQRKT